MRHFSFDLSFQRWTIEPVRPLSCYATCVNSCANNRLPVDDIELNWPAPKYYILTHSKCLHFHWPSWISCLSICMSLHLAEIMTEARLEVSTQRFWQMLTPPPFRLWMLDKRSGVTSEDWRGSSFGSCHRYTAPNPWIFSINSRLRHFTNAVVNK